MKYAIGFLCIIASSLSLWLSIEKLAGRITSLAGCGTDSGCANVLGSKWSVVFGSIPISFFSLTLYLAVLLSLPFSIRIIQRFRVLAAFIILAAAVWFIGLQIFLIKTICPYCMVVHSLGLLLGCSLLRLDWQTYRTSAVTFPLAGTAIVTALAMIQAFSPELDTHRIDSESDITFKAEQAEAITPTKNSVSFFDDAKSFEIKLLPHIGSPEAPHIIVKYFDYTCEACKVAHEHIDTFMEKHPGKLAVILLPVPLNHSCNPYYPNSLQDHDSACELAHLALNLWQTNPSQFHEFHNQLFELQGLPLEAAEAMAQSFTSDSTITPKQLSASESILKSSIEDYRSLSKKTPVMPKLLLKGSSILQGKAKDYATFEQLLTTELKIK